MKWIKLSGDYGGSMNWIISDDLALLMRLDAATLRIHGPDIFVDTSPLVRVDHDNLTPKQYASPIPHPERAEYAYPIDSASSLAYGIMVRQGVAMPPILTDLPEGWAKALARVTGH